MKVMLEWKYKYKKYSCLFTSEFMDIIEALELSKDIEKTGRIETLRYFDENKEEWTKKELEKWLKSLVTIPTNIKLYFDGGYQKDTRIAGAGLIIYYEQNKKQFRIRRNEQLEQLNSNNEAEYAALWLGICELEQLGVTHMPINIYGDSQVVINQITGIWPCYEEDFNRWIDKIEEKVKMLGIKPTYHLINRNENKEADQLASQAINNIQINSNYHISS